MTVPLSVTCCIEALSYRDTLYYVYLSLCLRLGLDMSYLCDLFFHYYFHFHCNQRYTRIDIFVRSSASGCCLAFA